MFQFIVDVMPITEVGYSKIRPHSWVSAQSDDINHIKERLRKSAARDMNLNAEELDEMDTIIQQCYDLVTASPKFKGMTFLFGPGDEAINVNILNEEDMKARDEATRALFAMAAGGEPTVLH